MRIFIILFTATIFFSCAPKEVEDTGPTTVELVQGLYDAFAQGDVETVMAGMSDEVEWNEAENFIYGGQYIGKDAVLQGVFARIGQEWEYWNLVDMTISAVEDDKALAQGRYQAKNNANGATINAQFAHYWELTDGLVTKFQQYVDTKQVAEAAAMPSSEE
jgi:ketosteroid isomerase-like protein